jgi:hypothetical protein
MSAPALADVRRSDLALAAMLTAAVFGSSLFALSHARLEHDAELPAIDPGLGVPISVRPVADVSSGVPGSAEVSVAQPVVPRAWRRKVPRARVKKRPATPGEQPLTPTPETSEHEAPIADSAAVEPDTSGAPEHAPVEDSGAEVLPPDDSSAEGEDEPEAPAETGGTEGGESEAETEGESAGAGGTDPLLERAIAFYRARLVGWFSARFRVTGSGLSSTELTKHRVRVHIELGEDLRIVDYQILSSDHPEFEKAARAMLEKMRGEKLPPPPENYPGAMQRRLTVTFTCAEDTCD